ncbi:uncharacterized protein LOC121779057 [Salvia splendens]|uniref:uncharacterized protein LOC121779057 n=1 Tax=Salvia splendens TaxID=180675 RepID=UPI001C27393A|nr:uncharacterized protein LOC121779057 [Salvia splendens]
MPLIQRVEQYPFAGRATEDANCHLSKFVEIANTLELNGVDDDAIKVRFYPFSLIDSTKEWFECLPTEQVSTWKDIVAAFLDKYYPPGTILKLKSEIFQFMQGYDEPLYEAVARFKGLLRKCPNHGFTVDHQGKTEDSCGRVERMPWRIKEFAINSRGWSKERPNSRRIAAIEEAEESSFVKELAELSMRVDQMDTSRREDPVPSTSVIAVTKPDTPPAPTEDVNYVEQGGGPHKPYNNSYRPSQCVEMPRYAKLLREAVMKKKKLTKADLKFPHHCSEIIKREKAMKQRDPDQFIIRCSIGQGRGEITISDNYSRSTYKTESAMLKYEETQQAKIEHECRMDMMTDTSKPYRPLEGEDLSKRSIFLVNSLPRAPKKNKPKLTKAHLQEKPKKKKKKTQPLVDPEVYVIKTSKGKYKWWKKMCNNLVPFAVFNTRVVDPPT